MTCPLKAGNSNLFKLMGDGNVMDRNACFRVFLGVDQGWFSVSDRRIFGLHHQDLGLRDRRGCHRICLEEISEQRQKQRSRPRQDCRELTDMNLVGTLQMAI
jgi:hypothetical protein